MKPRARPDGLGTLSPKKAIPEDYLPLSYLAGIEPSGDPLIDPRNDAHTISFSRQAN